VRLSGLVEELGDLAHAVSSTHLERTLPGLRTR
jgi:hypothetical protein